MFIIPEPLRSTLEKKVLPTGSRQPKFVPVNLSQHLNGRLHTSWLPNEDPGNNLASVPMGRQEFGGVIFVALTIE